MAPGLKRVGHEHQRDGDEAEDREAVHFRSLLCCARRDERSRIVWGVTTEGRPGAQGGERAGSGVEIGVTRERQARNQWCSTLLASAVRLASRLTWPT